jgi:hypothetical protein
MSRIRLRGPHPTAPDEKDTAMKTLLTAALALIAAPAQAGWLDKWFASQPERLQCEVTNTEQNRQAYNAGPHSQTWMIEIKNDQWHLVSINGIDLATAGKEAAEMGKFLPVRVTDAAYVLIEESDTTNGNYHVISRPVTINRSNGSLYGWTNTTEVNPTNPANRYWTQVETTGHCSPVSLSPQF